MRVEVPHKGAKVYIYTRVSTEMQVEGYSLDAQKVEILKEVRRHDMVVAGVNIRTKGVLEKVLLVVMDFNKCWMISLQEKMM